MTNDLTDVFGALHEDRATVLRAQLASILIEINERERITKKGMISLEEEILDLGGTILNLTRLDHPDLYLKERVAISEQRRTLTKEARAEERDSWRDVQELRREHRQIQQELVQAGQRRQRLEDLTLAPGPL